MSNARKDHGGIEIFVAADGNDRWSGRLAGPNQDKTDGPLATLVAARDVARAARKAGGDAGVVISLRGGDYFLDAGLPLAGEDSGAKDAPLVIQAYRQEKVRLIGGRAVSGWRPVEEQAVLARLDPAVRDKVLQADLGALGIRDLGALKSRGFGRPSTAAHAELFFNDQPMTLARWPNTGFVTIASIPASAGIDDGHQQTIGRLEEGFCYDGDRPSGWKSTEEAWVHGYWAWDWANSYEAIDSIDRSSRLIKTREPHGQYGFRAGQRFYYLNVLEELDAPGEYYIDRRAGRLYFYPPCSSEELNKARVLLSVLNEPLLSMKEAANVQVRGLTLECCRGHAVRIEGGESCLVGGCTIRNVGDYAVVVEGGRGHGVRSCDIYNTGDGGISLTGGDRKTLTPCGHSADNNHIHHVGRWSRCYVPAIIMHGVGTRVSRNLIHDHPHCAILFTGNEHLMELNEIHHVCLETGDVGAIYTGRDYTYRGNVVRHNFLHHTGGVGMGSMGVYNDDCVSGTVMFGNIFWGVQRAVFLGGGRDFRVENNIFVDCRPAVCLDGRGLDKHPVWHDMVYKTMKQAMADVSCLQPPYIRRYPELADLTKYYQKEDGVPPGNILVARNICRGKWLEVCWHATMDALTLRDNLTEGDPRFENEPAGDFRLKADSPAWKLGFQRIPLEQIGLVKDEFRKELPRSAPRTD
jgi:hypothetical protein